MRRTVNESQASIWLSQAEYDLQTALHLKEASDSAGRPFSSPAVFHASQAVEKALKSAMLRTCGLTTEEFTGQEGHDLEALHLRLKGADPETEPQKLAQDQLPGTTPDMAWLKKAYLATRYPNVLGAGQIPALAYCPSDAERACHLAQQVVPWAKTLKICRLAANRGGNPQGFGQTPRTPRRKLQGWLLLLLQGLSYKNRRQHRYQHHFRSDGSDNRRCQDC